MTATKIYFVACNDQNGESLDWFVEAENPQDAIEIWKSIDTVAEGGVTGETVKVFEVPSRTGQSRAAQWFSDAKLVLETVA